MSLTIDITEDVVVISRREYEKFKKAWENQMYMEEIDEAFEQLYSGKGTRHELIEVEDDA